MFKWPRKAYRVGRKQTEASEGTIAVELVHSKSDLRPGQYVSLFHLLKRLSLDELLVAGGEGVEIRRRALRRIPVRPF